MENTVCPRNVEHPDGSWDAQFGLPLINTNSKKKIAQQIKKEHDEYNKSLGKFNKYQMDKKSLIKTDITIDPFKSENKRHFKGKAIRDIYDEQVAGPKATPKKIIRRCGSSIIYDNESEMNGGMLSGTSMHGYNGSKYGFKSANFGNEFQ